LTDWKFIFNKWVLHQGRSPFYEKKVKKELRHTRGDLFVDVGANQGLYSIALAKNFRTVYAFEPNPKMVQALNNKLKERKITNVRVFAKALGDTTGRTTLYQDPHEGCGGCTDTILSVFRYDPHTIPEGGTSHVYIGKTGVEVDVSTYDSIVRLPADLVKIDVEGAEFKVLDGMEKSLKARKVKEIVVELHDKTRRDELEKKLDGFLLKWIDEDHLRASLP
jgi:FkbM family methyltransferase